MSRHVARRGLIGAALVAHLAVLLGTSRSSLPLESEALTAGVALDPSSPTQDLRFTTEVPYGYSPMLRVQLNVEHDGLEDGTLALVSVAPDGTTEGPAWYEHTFEGDPYYSHGLNEATTEPIDPEPTEHHVRITWDGAAAVEGTVTLSVVTQVWTEREARREDPPEISWE